MFQKDYIMRMIEQFTNVLGKVVGLKYINKLEEAQQVLNESLQQFTGFGEATTEILSTN